MTPPLKKIVLVDDEKDIQAIVKLALESLGGFKVEICSSGNEAVIMIPEYLPDLILMDIMMPVMDGPALIKALQGIGGMVQIPVVFMTANTQPHEVVKYKSMGAIDVITKPFDPMTLANTINKIWRVFHERLT